MNFFSNHHGIGGHISHYNGIKEGFEALSIKVNVVYRDKIFNKVSSEYFNHFNYYKTSFLNNLSYCFFLNEHVKKTKPEFIYIRYSISFALYIPIIRLLTKKKIILEANSIAKNHSKILAIFDFIGFYFASLVVCNSSNTRLSLIGISKKFTKKTIVIPNAVSENLFSLADSVIFKKKNSFFNIGFFGTLKGGKYGIETLIETFKSLDIPNARLYIFGEGDHKEKLLELASNNKNIFFKGFIPHNSIYHKFLEMDLLVNTSYFETQSSIKLSEYLVSKIPVLIAYNYQDSELLLNGKFGYIYQGGDVKDMKEKIKLIYNEYETAKLKAENAFDYMRTFHTWKHRAAHILEMYRTL